MKQKTDTRQKIVQMVLEKMKETEKAPWDSGFVACPLEPVNLMTGKKYRGVNSFILRAFGRGANEYVTIRQADKLGGRVRKGEHGLPVIWYSMWNRTKKMKAGTDADEDGDEIVPYMKSTTVFEVSQCEGLTGKRVSEFTRSDAHRNEQIDNWFDAFCKETDLTMEHTLSNAAYSPSMHRIRIRHIDEYNDDDSYYQTLFHEAVHSTGKHFGRPEFKHWGDHLYSEEEIVAEMGSLFLCEHFGIVKSQLNNSVAYLESWGKKLQDNPNWLIHGVKNAEKAVDYMLEMEDF